MNLKARLTIVDPSTEKMVVIVGLPRPIAALGIRDATTSVKETEKYLSRLLGMQVTLETESI